MDTITQGLFVTTRGWAQGPSANKPATRVRPDGTFVVRMPLINPQGRRNEAYLVTWEGPEAEVWWDQHHGIGSGQPLHLVIAHPLLEQGLHGPCIHAQVRSCRLLPRPATGSRPTAPDRAS